MQRTRGENRSEDMACGIDYVPSWDPVGTLRNWSVAALKWRLPLQNEIMMLQETQLIKFSSICS